MKKVSYEINPETLEIQRVEFNLKEFLLKKILPKSFLPIAISAITALVLLYNFGSPINNTYYEKYTNLKLKFDLLNRDMNKMATDLALLADRDDNIYRAIFEASPLPASLRRAGFGGAEKYKYLKGYESSKLIINSTVKLDILSKQLVVQSKSYDEIIDMVKNKEEFLASRPAIQPLSLRDIKRYGSGFGMRMHPKLHVWKMHTGIDLSANTGTKVYATGDGTVVRADWAHGYGNCVRISHGYGYLTLYAHLSKILVKPGQKVKRGDVIGLVGNTGLSVGPHLHYEVRINGKPVNPVSFFADDLTDEEYDKMIKASATANTHIFWE